VAYSLQAFEESLKLSGIYCQVYSSDWAGISNLGHFYFYNLLRNDIRTTC